MVASVRRAIHVQALRINGAIREEGEMYPTTKSGRFEYGPTYVDYGGTDSSGFFYNGHVPWEGAMPPSS